MAFEPSKHVNGRMWPPGVSGNPNGNNRWPHRIQPKLSERPSLGLGRAWSRDGQRVIDLVYFPAGPCGTN